MLYMTQDVGMSRPTDTLREMLIEVAPANLREAGRELVRAERAMQAGEDDGMAYATALSGWSISPIPGFVRYTRAVNKDRYWTFAIPGTGLSYRTTRNRARNVRRQNRE
jgi:hypothetical protein